MSKHRRKDRRTMGNNHQNMGGRNPMMNNPFGIDPKQLLGMLGGNMDMGRLNNMLSSMNSDGFDLNSISQMMGMNNSNGTSNNMNYNNQQSNQGSNQSAQQQMGGAGFNFNNLMNMMNGMTNNQSMNGNINPTDMNNNISNDIGDSISDSDVLNVNNEPKRKSHKKEHHAEKKENIEDDENIKMLRSIREIVDFKKAEFIDKVIEAYLNGEFEEN